MEYKFNDNDHQATLVVRPKAIPFPDIPTKAPGILTEHEIHGVSSIQDEPAQSIEEQAMLAEENLGIKFGPVDTHKRHEVIELVDDDDDEDILIDFILFRTTLQSRPKDRTMKT